MSEKTEWAQLRKKKNGTKEFVQSDTKLKDLSGSSGSLL
jgi:hypothetical protein